jgi:hypothetical protein
MARVFVHHDESGKILSVAVVRTMPEGLGHPFHLAQAAHGVLEVAADDPAFAGGFEQAHETQIVDIATGKLVPAARGEPVARAPKKPAAAKPAAPKRRRPKPPSK